MQRNLSRPEKYNSKARHSGNAEAPRRGNNEGGVARLRKTGVNVPRTIDEPDLDEGRGKKRRTTLKTQRGVGQKNYDDDDDDDNLAATFLSDELRDALASNSGYGVRNACILKLAVRAGALLVLERLHVAVRSPSARGSKELTLLLLLLLLYPHRCAQRFHVCVNRWNAGPRL